MLTRLGRLALRKGLVGSNAWLVLGLAAGGAQLLKRMAARDEKVVFSEKLAPGKGLVITHLGPDE